MRFWLIGLKRSCWSNRRVCKIRWWPMWAGFNLFGLMNIRLRRGENVKVSPAVLEALEAQLRTIYLGMPHHSSVIHEMVIDKMETNAQFNEAFFWKRCDDVLLKEKKPWRWEIWRGLGRFMRENTAIQEEMHGELVSEDAKALIAEFDALCLGMEGEWRWGRWRFGELFGESRESGRTLRLDLQNL